MFECHPFASKALPKEYRSTADKLFPPGGFTEGKSPSAEAAAHFAEVLGVGEDFRRLSKAHKSGNAKELLSLFQNNLDLLIQKTWVEKTDEARKEKLQDQVPPFIAFMENGNYAQALEEFGEILGELVHLFFGAQSKKDDFAEYVIRIDTQMGLFWWYGGQIHYARGASWIKNADQNTLQALLFVGICYLTDF